jgi:hypothetical protein
MSLVTIKHCEGLVDVSDHGLKCFVPLEGPSFPEEVVPRIRIVFVLGKVPVAKGLIRRAPFFFVLFLQSLKEPHESLAEETDPGELGHILSDVLCRCAVS